MNESERILYETPSFFENPINHLQEIWTLILADFNSAGMSFQRACLLSCFTIELLHQARTLPTENDPQRSEIARFLQWYPHIFLKTQGGYLNHLLGQSIVNEVMMTNRNIEQFQKSLETRITYMLTEWVETYKQLKKSKQEKLTTDVANDTWGILNTFLAKVHYDNIYDKLLFIEFIKNDLLAVEADWLAQSDKALQHTDSVARFLTLLLPKVLFNIQMQAEYFPKAMTEPNPKATYDILYLNENKHAQLVKRVLFYDVISALLSNLLNNFFKLSEKEQPGILNIVFNYFYAYHSNSFEKCCSFLTIILEKLPSVIRFAKFNEIMLFLAVLDKFQYQQFVGQLFEKFKWIQEYKQKLQNPPSNPRNAVDIFLNEEKIIMVPASQVVVQLVEVFRPYSLVYFDINCKSADIDVNLYYAGDFNDRNELKKLVFEKKRLRAKEEFKGSIEAVQPGLYYLELNNSYSWMTAKTIGYKLEVIVPMDIYYPYRPSPYSRFLHSQLSLGIPYQLKIDYDFFHRGENETGLCEIRVTKNNYLIDLGTHSYQLQTSDSESAKGKIAGKLNTWSQTLNINGYSVNGKKYHAVKVAEIMVIVSEVINVVEIEDIPSPVEMLKDVESNRESVVDEKVQLPVISEVDGVVESSKIEEKKAVDVEKTQVVEKQEELVAKEVENEDVGQDTVEIEQSLD